MRVGQKCNVDDSKQLEFITALDQVSLKQFYKGEDGFIYTDVSPLIKRQLPELDMLNDLKRLKVDIFLDYFSINLIDVNQDFIDKCRVEIKKINTGYFKEGSSYSYKSKKLKRRIYYRLFTGFMFESPFQYQLQLNPKQFKDGKDFLRALKKIAGPLNKANHKIGRVDVAFNIPRELFGAGFINMTAHMKWKRKSARFISRTDKLFRGSFTGVRTCSGTMNISTYDENAKATNLGKILSDPDEFPALTKHEFQINSRALASFGILEINDFKKLSDGRIFKRIEFYDPLRIDGVNFRLADRFREFQTELLLVGHHHARARLNKNRNFSRDLGKALLAIRINGGKARLSYCLRKRFNIWLKKWMPKNINRYVE